MEFRLMLNSHDNHFYCVVLYLHCLIPLVVVMVLEQIGVLDLDLDLAYLVVYRFGY